jgi:uncharacterized membrane protein
MEEYIKYIIVSFIILVLDGIWIYNNLSMYSNAVKFVQKTNLIVNYYYAAVAYILVLFASLYVAIPFTKVHLKKQDSIKEKLYKSLIYGGAVGFSIYGLYNFTSLSIYKDYPLSVGIIDTLWGTFLNTIVVFIYSLL